jgi:hypothetical protein
MPILLSRLVMKPVLSAMAAVNMVLLLGDAGLFLIFPSTASHLAASQPAPRQALVQPQLAQVGGGN